MKPALGESPKLDLLTVNLASTSGHACLEARFQYDGKCVPIVGPG